MFEWHSLDHVPLATPTPRPRTRARRRRLTTSTSTRSTSSRTAICWSTRATPGPPTTSIRRPARCAGSSAASTQLHDGRRARAPAWQHDARQQPDGTITFFDNGATPTVHPQSRAIELALDTQHHDRDARARAIEHPTPLVAGSQGNLQALAGRQLDGGLGRGPLPLGIQPQRASCSSTRTCPPPMSPTGPTALPWTGRPDRAAGAAPRDRAGAAGRGDRRLRELERGDRSRLLAGARGILADDPDAGRERAQDGLRDRDRAAGRGRRRYVAVQALDGSGAVIGISATVRSRTRPCRPCVPPEAGRVRRCGASALVRVVRGRLHVLSGVCGGPRAFGGVLGGGEVVGEAAGVRGAQARGAAERRSSSWKARSKSARSAASSGLCPALLCSSSRPPCVR